MDSREKLHKFMLAKARKLERVVGIGRATYYNAKDKEIIFNLSETRSTKIWRGLKFNIKRGLASSLDTTTCIFCLVSNVYCSICAYGENHGICTESGSAYRKICNKADDKRIPLGEVLSNEYYTKLVKRIESK